jgi:hypothetical protein
MQQFRSWEWELYQPLVGSSMLELGNKRKAGPNGQPLIYKEFFERLGFRHVSVDTNGQDGALPLDLRQPINLGTFDMVTNIGTSEHVSEDAPAGQAACWRNICEAMHVGSVLVSITPLAGHWLKHGTWYPQPEFFRELARLNGMTAERIYTSHERPQGCPERHGLVYARLVRRELVPFQMPTVGMHRNARC